MILDSDIMLKTCNFLSIPDNFGNFESEFLMYDSGKWKK